MSKNIMITDLVFIFMLIINLFFSSSLNDTEENMLVIFFNPSNLNFLYCIGKDILKFLKM